VTAHGSSTGVRSVLTKRRLGGTRTAGTMRSVRRATRGTTVPYSWGQQAYYKRPSSILSPPRAAAIRSASVTLTDNKVSPRCRGARGRTYVSVRPSTDFPIVGTGDGRRGGPFSPRRFSVRARRSAVLRRQLFIYEFMPHDHGGHHGQGGDLCHRAVMRSSSRAD